MGMILALSALLAVLLGIGTLAWWRVGDTWADSEHKKFKAKERSGPGPRVIGPLDPPHSQSDPSGVPQEKRDG